MGPPDPHSAFRRARAANLANPIYRAQQEAKCAFHLERTFELDSLLYKECGYCGRVRIVKRSDLTAKQRGTVERLTPLRSLSLVCSFEGCPETKGVQLHHIAFVEIFGYEMAERFPKVALCEYHHIEVLHRTVEAWAGQPLGQMLIPPELNRWIASG